MWENHIWRFRERRFSRKEKKPYNKNNASEPSCRGRVKDRENRRHVGFVSREQTLQVEDSRWLSALGLLGLFLSPLAWHFLFLSFPFKHWKGNGMHLIHWRIGEYLKERTGPVRRKWKEWKSAARRGDKQEQSTLTHLYGNVKRHITSFFVVEY